MDLNLLKLEVVDLIKKLDLKSYFSDLEKMLVVISVCCKRMNIVGNLTSNLLTIICDFVYYIFRKREGNCDYIELPLSLFFSKINNFLVNNDIDNNLFFKYFVCYLEKYFVLDICRKTNKRNNGELDSRMPWVLLLSSEVIDVIETYNKRSFDYSIIYNKPFFDWLYVNEKNVLLSFGKHKFGCLTFVSVSNIFLNVSIHSYIDKETISSLNLLQKIGYSLDINLYIFLINLSIKIKFFNFFLKEKESKAKKYNNNKNYRNKHD